MENLQGFEEASVTFGDATKLAMPHVLYVNAGVCDPLAHRLKALNPGGRTLLPWSPTSDISIALLIKRMANGYQVEPKMEIRIIPCVGTFETAAESKKPSRGAASATCALHLTAERPPDETATAIFHEVWFSCRPLGHS
jgi:protein-L-isoaspartate(D-aspartate) O-methyltransferase